ncbi:MAG: hypothetical protein ACMG6S_04890 [Byssovorax sp.]
MASIYTPDGTKVSLEVLRTLITFLLARLTSEPNAAAFVAPVKALRNDWNPVAAKEMDLEETITIAQAGAVAADRRLNAASALVKNAIHKGKKPDLSLPLHKLYFGSDSPSVFEKPTLAAQLAAMQAWPALLTSAAQPELNALVASVTAAVKEGDVAAKALADANTARDAFRLGGERKKIFDRFNSACATTYGALKALVHDHPELGLASGYAESFFHRAPAARAQPLLTLDEANIEVKSLEKQLEEAKEQRDDLQGKEAAHAAQMKRVEAALLEAQEAKKRSDDADQAAKAAQEEAQKLSPKPKGKPKK